MPSLERAGFSAVHLAGIASRALGASIDAARAAGLSAMGGVSAAELADDPVAIGRFAGNEARVRGLMVCDDGGLTTAAEIGAYRLAISAAREGFSAGASGR
jgi:hypothetical protein